MRHSRALNKPRDVCDIPCFDPAKVKRLRAGLARNEAYLPELAEFYKLLGNTTRLKILLALENTELCVCDIAHVLDLAPTKTATYWQLVAQT